MDREKASLEGLSAGTEYGGKGRRKQATMDRRGAKGQGSSMFTQVIEGKGR
jgi:hypothetical protein